jgi:hypothetical protein
MPTASSLSTLILRKSSICERTIGQLLACTPRLKHLTYDHWRYIDWDWPGFGGDRQIRCRLLNMALSHVKDSLESLIIKVRFVSCEVEPPNHENSDYPCSISGRLNVIRSMRKLRSVEVPWLLLHNWDSEVPPTVWTDILPYTLQSLCIRDDLCAKYAYPWMPPREDIVYNHVSVLLNIKSRYFPQLRRVSFTYIWDCYIEGWRDGNAGRFQALCTSKDVYCEVNREGDLYRA